jgi:hypothetical protein
MMLITDRTVAESRIDKVENDFVGVDALRSLDEEVLEQKLGDVVLVTSIVALLNIQLRKDRGLGLLLELGPFGDFRSDNGDLSRSGWSLSSEDRKQEEGKKGGGEDVDLDCVFVTSRLVGLELEVDDTSIEDCEVEARQSAAACGEILHTLVGCHVDDPDEDLSFGILSDELAASLITAFLVADCEDQCAEAKAQQLFCCLKTEANIGAGDQTTLAIQTIFAWVCWLWRDEELATEKADIATHDESVDDGRIVQWEKLQEEPPEGAQGCSCFDRM